MRIKKKTIFKTKKTQERKKKNFQQIEPSINQVKP